MLPKNFGREYNEEEARAVHESSNSTDSECSSTVETKKRRFRNNNSNKETNKNVSRKKDINKVISGRIRKKNPDIIKASVKKVPDKKPTIKVKFDMRKKSPSKSDLAEENILSKSLTSPTTFNPVDNLFIKLKKQMEHSQPGPSGIQRKDCVITTEHTSICKMNVNRQLDYSKKQKKLGKKKSIIHERLAMPLLPASSESVTSSDSSGFKDDLTSSSSGSPTSEKDSVAKKTDEVAVCIEVPKMFKQKERTSPRNKAVSPNDQVLWVNVKSSTDSTEQESIVLNDVIVIPDTVTDVPQLKNNVIVIDEPAIPRLSPRTKKNNEKSPETSFIQPNISNKPIPGSDTVINVEESIAPTTLLKMAEPASENVINDKSTEKPKRRRRLMPTAIPSIFFNTPMLLRSELAQKRSSVPEKKPAVPVIKGSSRLLRSELNIQEKPLKSKKSSPQANEGVAVLSGEPSISKISKSPPKNYEQNDNLIYEVVNHPSKFSESSNSSSNEVICLDDAQLKVEPLIIKLKLSQQKKPETAPKTKATAESQKDKRISADGAAKTLEKSQLKLQVSQFEDTKGKVSQTVEVLPPKQHIVQQKSPMPEIPVEKPGPTVHSQITPPTKDKPVIFVRDYETLKIDTSVRKSPNKLISPKKVAPKVSPKPVQIAETETATKKLELDHAPKKIIAKAPLSHVETKKKDQETTEILSNDFIIETNNTRRLLRSDNFTPKSDQEVHKIFDSDIILVQDETRTPSDSVHASTDLFSQKVASPSPKQPTKSKEAKILLNHPHNKIEANEKVSHPETSEIINLCTTDSEDSKITFELPKKIKIHSDLKLQKFVTNDEPPNEVKDKKDVNKNFNRKDINRNMSPKDNITTNNTKTVNQEDKSIKSNTEVEFTPKPNFIPKEDISQANLDAPKTDMKNVQSNSPTPVIDLLQDSEVEVIETVELSSEKTPEKMELKRTLRSDMKLAEVSVAQNVNTCPQMMIENKSQTVMKPDVRTMKPSGSSVEKADVQAKLVEEISEPKHNSPDGKSELPEVSPRLLRSDKAQQKVLEDRNKNVLSDTKSNPQKLDSPSQTKKSTQPDLITEQKKKNNKDNGMEISDGKNKTSPKTGKSRSSLGQKVQKKQENLDEIIVVTEKKMKKQNETSTRMLRSSFIEPATTIIKTEVEEVVVLIHEEPKNKQIVATTAKDMSIIENAKEEEAPPCRSLRSQKVVADVLPVRQEVNKGKEKSIPERKTSIKNKLSMKTHILRGGASRLNKNVKTVKVLQSRTKNVPATDGEKKAQSSRVTRQKITKPLKRLRRKTAAEVSKTETLSTRLRSEKLQKQDVAKNKKSKKTNVIDWKNNKIIENIIQEIKNTIFLHDDEENIHLEEGNISSDESSPKENVVPTNKKATKTSKDSNKGKKMRRPSLKEIRNVKNTRSNKKIGLETKQVTQKNKLKPKVAPEKLSKASNKRGGRKVDQTKTELDMPKKTDLKNESEPFEVMNEKTNANGVQATSVGKESFQVVESCSKEVIVDDRSENSQAQTNGGDLEVGVVATRQYKKRISEKVEPKKRDVKSVSKADEKSSVVAKRKYNKKTVTESVVDSPALDINQSTSKANQKEDSTLNDAEDNSQVKETYQMVNSFLEEIIVDDENEDGHPQIKSENLDVQVVAKRQYRKRISEKVEPSKKDVKITAKNYEVPQAVVKKKDNKKASVETNESAATCVDQNTSNPKEDSAKDSVKDIFQSKETYQLVNSFLEVISVDDDEGENNDVKVKSEDLEVEVVTNRQNKKKEELDKNEDISQGEKTTDSLLKETMQNDESENHQLKRKNEDVVKRQYKKRISEKENPREQDLKSASKAEENSRVVVKGKYKKTPVQEVDSLTTDDTVIVVGDKESLQVDASPQKVVDGGSEKNLLKRKSEDVGGEVLFKRRYNKRASGKEETNMDTPKATETSKGAKKKKTSDKPEGDQSNLTIYSMALLVNKLLKKDDQPNEGEPEAPEVEYKDETSTIEDVQPNSSDVTELVETATPNEAEPETTGEKAEGSTKKADITVFDFDESEPEITPLRHKASPESSAVAGKEKARSWLENSTEEVDQNRATPKVGDVSENTPEGPNRVVEQPKKKMWSVIEKEKPPRKSAVVNEVQEKPVASPVKSTSPMKQLTILEMFGIPKPRKIVGSNSPAGGSTSSPATVTSAAAPEAPSSSMPPPKVERPACKPEFLDEDESDCESRAEWIPEEYAEYKMKYSRQKMMQNKPVYKCKVCLKVFPSYYKLMKHRKEHELKDNPYVCPQCEADFNDIEDFAAHLRGHKGKQPYTCMKCNVGFWTREAYDAHAPVHVLRKLKPPEKRFRCDVCAKEFSKLCDVERHSRVHTGEKPCVCNICNRGFQQQHNLSKHLLTHLNLRPFPCEICNKQFGRADVLARHLLIHSIDKPIKCWVCQKGFIRQSQLTQHHRKHHPDKPIKPEPEDGEEGEA